MRALIDADYLVYSCGFAVEKCKYTVYADSIQDQTFNTKPEATSYVASLGLQEYAIHPIKYLEPIENAYHSLNETIKMIMEQTGCTSYQMYISGSDNFRDKLVDYYKKNRDPTHKPIYYNELREFLIHSHNATVVDGMEADDAVAIEQTSYERSYHTMALEGQEEGCTRSIICSIDKDLDMVPGWHFNISKRTRYFISEIDGYRNFYKQLLSGDSTDNIPGLFSITGKKAAAKYVDPISTMDDPQKMKEYVVGVYLSNAGDRFTQDEMMDKIEEIGKLLWIRRYENEEWKL